MFWQEDKEQTTGYVVPDDVQDLLFKIQCKTLPLDHGHVLSEEILKYLPWMVDEPQAGIHQIHVAESANGWMRPEDPETEVLCVSRRTKMTLRLPKHRIEQARDLVGQTLDISGHSLVVGEYSARSLSKLTTIFARYVDTGGVDDENQFLQSMADQLIKRGIRVRKMMSGKLIPHNTPDGPVLTRKLMLSDLEVTESVELQQQGVGSLQLLGMGIFMPHKGIDAVNKSQEKE